MLDHKPSAFKVIYQFNLDSHISEDHFLRQVRSAVDFSFIKDLVRAFYSDRGAPSIDPVVIFKMSLLGYFYGISSERRLAEECKYNLAFKWFLNYDIDEDTPDHSIFSKARARFGRDTYEKFFAEIVRRCVEKDLVDGEKMFMDATVLKANASRKSLVNREQYPQPKQTLKEYLDALWTENPAADDNAKGDGGKGDGKTSGRGRKPRTNETVVSTTDPDSTLVKRPGESSMLAHKVHIAVADGKSRIVTAVTTTSGTGHENEQVTPLVEKHHFITRKDPKELVADSAYGIKRVFEYLAKRGIQANIPFRSSYTNIRKKKLDAGFRYDEGLGTWVCPQGKSMIRRSKRNSAGHVKYISDIRECVGCPNHKVKCTKFMTITDSQDDEILNQVREHMESEAGKKSYRQRKWQVEPVFGELKTTCGMQKANLRGNRNVQIQALMAFSAYNIKRLVKAITLNTKGNREGLQGTVPSVSHFWCRLLSSISYARRVPCLQLST